MVAKKPAKKVTKKAPVKKSDAKKATPTKSVAKKVAPKKKVASKPRAKKAAKMQSFRLYKDTEGFTSFRVTRQTFYWSILLLVIIVMQITILSIQLEIAALTDALLYAE